MLWTTRIVLIVDREDAVLDILKNALESTDYVLLQAKTGDAAVAVISRLKSDIDLAIIDLELPDDNGLVDSLLTIFSRRSTTKVIVKTSRQDKPFLEKVNDVEIDAIVLRPISKDELIQTIQATFSGNPGNSGLTASTTNGGSGHTLRPLWKM